MNVRACLGLIGYYKNYVKEYSPIALSWFDLTKKDKFFIRTLIVRIFFNLLKDALVFAPILIRPNFTKAFILDVDWSTRGMKVIMSQKDKRNEHVIAYASKGLSLIQKKFHPMEGECYALVWGIVHFK
jgi:hypothetical protein